MNEIELMRDFGDNLKMELKENGITAGRLSYETGISESAIYYYIRGERMPSVLNVIKIMQALDCEFEDLFDISEPLI